jgi:predicted ATPase
VPKQSGGVCQFTFHDLCGKPLGAADYMTIARHYHSVIVSDIPILTAVHHNEARRFITLIDILYENGIGFVCSAQAPLENIFQLEEVIQQTIPFLMI